MEKHRTVLLVDDDDHVREGLQAVIERAGGTCLAAENGVQALALLREKAVQAIVADHDMPGMDGVELLRLVATRYPHISRILLTARREAEVAVRAINVGHAHRYLTKPCRNSDLLTVLHFAFEASDIQVENGRLGAELRRQNALLAEMRRRYPGVLEEIEARLPQVVI
jgi:DNA-binding NtrC family response regulator